MSLLGLSLSLGSDNLQAASSQVSANEPSSSTAPAKCLNIHLYNLARVSSRILDGATQDAARILATAGIDTVCWQVLADAPEAHTLHTSPPPTWRNNRQAVSRRYLVAVIMPGVPVDYFPGALGYALPDAEIGVHTMIFYDRIERFRESGKIDLPTLLGHAMAHEIGHVLLGTTEHSTAGIMKARWSKDDFEVAGLKVMTFTATQRAEVRRGLIAQQQISSASDEKGMTAVQAAAPEPGPVTGSTGAKLFVRLYDYAQVPRGVLTWAEQEAAHVFQVAGIRLSWVE